MWCSCWFTAENSRLLSRVPSNQYVNYIVARDSMRKNHQLSIIQVEQLFCVNPSLINFFKCASWQMGPDCIVAHQGCHPMEMYFCLVRSPQGDNQAWAKEIGRAGIMERQKVGQAANVSVVITKRSIARNQWCVCVSLPCYADAQAKLKQFCRVPIIY